MHSVQRQPEHTGSCICTMEMLLISKAFFFSFNETCSSFSYCKRNSYKEKGEKRAIPRTFLFYISNFCTNIEGGRLGVCIGVFLFWGVWCVVWFWGVCGVLSFFICINCL